MSGATETALRAAALTGEECEVLLTEMLRRLHAANQVEPLPAGFLDHQEDLKSARGTIERVCAELRAVTKGEAVSA